MNMTCDLRSSGMMDNSSVRVWRHLSWRIKIFWSSADLCCLQGAIHAYARENFHRSASACGRHQFRTPLPRTMDTAEPQHRLQQWQGIVEVEMDAVLPVYLLVCRLYCWRWSITVEALTGRDEINVALALVVYSSRKCWFDRLLLQAARR